MSTDIKLPELGENIESGDVLRVMVKPGDHVQKDQPLLELETDKATVEVPSSAEGLIKDIKIKAGDKVKVGQTILVIDEDGSGPSAPVSKPTAVPPSTRPTTPPAAPAESKRPAQVVEMTRQAPPASPRDVTAASPRQAPPSLPRDAAPASARQGKLAAVDPASIPAAPSARRLARELGVNLPDIQGSGPAGRVSTDDVTAFARRALASAASGGRPAAMASLPDFSAWGPVERKPMTGVRRTTAHRLTQAWNTVPHVVQYDRADITGTDALRKRLSKHSESANRAPVTITALLVQVLAAALKKFPQANASADLAADEIIYKQYIHIGVAVDTDRGLLVPVIRDVDQKDIFQIADEIAAAAEKARSRKLALEDMQGGSFTISNLGGLGGGPFSPIVNWPEVAILGVSRARMEPVWADGAFVPRFLLPLSLSYDHRVVDGADGVRFLRWVVEALEQPALIYIPEL